MSKNLERFLLPIVVSLTAFSVHTDHSFFNGSSQQYQALLQKSSSLGVTSRDRIALDFTVKGSNVLPKSQSCFSRLTANLSVLQQLQQFSDELILTSEKIVTSQANLRDFDGGSHADLRVKGMKAAVNAIVQLKGLNFPPPRTQGQATIPLKPLEGSQVFSLELTLGNTSGEFLFDTGASTTMLSTSIVQQLGLVGERIASEQLTSAVAGKDCPEMSARVHQLPTITVDGVRVEELRGLEFTNTLIPDELSGVLGMDFLRHFDLKLNPKTQQLQLLRPSQLNASQTQQAIPLTSRLGVMLAELEINDQGPFIFMLDTGADTIFISPHLANTLQLNQANRQPIQVIGFCGLEMAERSTLKQVKMGEFQQNNLEAVILSSPSVLDLLEVDGILGQNFFNAYEQYWRFNSNLDSNTLSGSLILSPIQKK